MALTFNMDAAKRMLLDSYDCDELVDILEIDADELLDRFEDRVELYLLHDSHERELLTETNPEKDEE